MLCAHGKDVGCLKETQGPGQLQQLLTVEPTLPAPRAHSSSH